MRSLTTLFIVLFITLSSTCFAGGYKLYKTESGVEVYAKWSEKKGKMVLCLKVVNTSSSAVSASMDINFYDVATVAESSEIKDLCIEAGKNKKGAKHKLCFASEQFNEAQVMDESFHWLIENLVVNNTEGCP